MISATGCRSVFLLQEKFTTRHELALLRVSALSGLVMFGAMSSLFYTQMTGILSVSTDIFPRECEPFKGAACEIWRYLLTLAC